MKWHHKGWYRGPDGRMNFHDGLEVYYKDKKYYIWHNYLNHNYILCEDKKDVGIKGYRLRSEELDDVMSVEEYRDSKLNKLGL
jgi:hypothetical protein